MNFSRTPKWIWVVGGLAVLLLAFFFLSPPVTVDIPPAIPPLPR
jgi:hypothetical protein